MLLENETTIRPPTTHTMQTQNWRRFLLMIVKDAYYAKSNHFGYYYQCIVQKTVRKYNINLSQHTTSIVCLLQLPCSIAGYRHITWQVIQLKPYRSRIVSLDFQQMVRLRNFLCHMGTPLEGHSASLTSSLPTKGRVTFATR